MRTQGLAILGSALLVGACSGISVSTDYDPSVDFTRFTSYTWLDTEGDNIDNITDSRVRNSVNAALAARGFQENDSNPDMAVGYQGTTAERKSYNTVNSGWGGGYGGYGWGGYGMSMGTSTTYENTWQEGSLILGLFDVESKALVWTGTATATLDQGRSPEERQQLIDDAVEKMMKKFPPGS